MEGAIHPELLRLVALGPQKVDDVGDRGSSTGKHHRARSVHRGDGHLLIVAGQQRAYLFLVRADRHHHPTTRQGLHQPAPRRHETAGIGKGPHAGRIRRGDLPERMPHDVVRGQTPGLQQAKQPDLHGEQRRLSEARLRNKVRCRGPRLREHHFAQRAVQHPVEHGAHLVEGIREHRVPVVQLPPHAGPLRSLTREQVSRPASGDSSHHNARRFFAVCQAAQLRREVRARVRDQHGTMVQHRASGRQGPPDIVHRQLFGPIDKLRQTSCLRTQSRSSPARDQPRDRTPAGRSGLFDRARRLGDNRGRRFHDHVRVRAAGPERGDACPPGTAGVRPGAGLGQQRHRTRGPINVRRRLVHVQGFRQLPVSERHDHLDHAGDARCGLGMPDVGLQRTQPQWTVRRSFRPVGGEQCRGLDRITQRGTGTVGLGRVHIAGCQAGIRQGLPDHPLLCWAVRCSQAIRRAILVDRRTPHHGQNGMVVALSFREPFQYEHARAFGPRRPIRRGRERLAPSVSRQAPLPRKLDERPRVRHHRHTAGQRDRALALPQRLTRPVQRHQRRRTHGVDRDRRAFQPQRIRQSAGHHGRGTAGEQVALDASLGVEMTVPVARWRCSHEHPGVTLPQGMRVDAGVFQRFPCRFQQQPLLRIHRDGFAWRDPEELRVEVRRVVQETAVPHVRGAWVVRVRVVQLRQLPAPVLREGPDHVPLGDHQPPQLVRRTHAPRETAPHPHDRDRLVRGRGHRHPHRCLRAPRPPQQVLCERGRGRLVEDQCRGQPQTGRLHEPIPQLHGGQRIQSEVLERPANVDGSGIVLPEHHSGLGADQFEHDFLLLAGGKPG